MGVVVFSISDIPLGFGMCMKTTQQCREIDPAQVVVINQADVGEYLRCEDDIWEPITEEITTENAFYTDNL